MGEKERDEKLIGHKEIGCKTRGYNERVCVKRECDVHKRMPDFFPVFFNKFSIESGFSLATRQYY